MSSNNKEILSGTRRKAVDVSSVDFKWDDATLATNPNPTPFKINCSDDCQLWCVFFDDFLDGVTTALPYNFSYGDNPALLVSVNFNAGNSIDGSASGDINAVI